MNFKYNKSLNKTVQLNRFSIDNFLGVDFTNSKLNVDKHRATDMKNFIHKDGINHKRSGWNEIVKIGWDPVLDVYDPNGTPLKINGFWSFTDSYENEHTIVHAGQKIFSIEQIGKNSFETSPPTDITETCTYNPSYTTLSTWKEKITTSIKNERSFGIVRGDRLYIFCGIYLVYGTWDAGANYELRPVEDNEDTYIPTTTIGISANGSDINVRQTMDEVNLLCRKRRNKLIGEPNDSHIPFYPLDDYPLPDSYFEGSAQFISGYPMGYVINQERIDNVLGVKIVITDGEDTFIGYQRMSPTIDFDNTDSGKEAWFLNTSGNKTFLDMVSIYKLYAKKSEENTINLTFAFGKNTQTSIVNVYLVRRLVYQLDVTSFAEEQTPKVFINGGKTATSNYEDFFGDFVGFSNSINTNGQFTMDAFFPPLIEGQSNIIVEFAKPVNGNADKVNKCMFGTFFGVNDYEHLFVSGNPDSPNYDFHSSYPDATETQSDIPVYDDLTYFGDLGYAKIGSPQKKITGYSLLEDGTLAIHKEWSKDEPNIWLRQTRIDNVLDLAGNMVVDIYGNPYQKVYYPQFAGSIGEGMISRYCNDNLSGDKLFLSKNGLFGVVLNPNIKSNERFARERSRLINSRLTKEPNLEEAVGIVFDNKYYLAVNGKCYIADARFKNQLSAEMPDTFSYEWWYWDNMPVRIWFIYNGKLAFGTEKGQICILDNVDYADKIHKIFRNGDLIINFDTDTLTLNASYDETLAQLKNDDCITISCDDSELILSELILLPEDIVSVEEGIFTVTFEAFTNKVRFLEDEYIYLDGHAELLNSVYQIKNIDFDNMTFELHDTVAKEIDTTINLDVYPDIIVVKPIVNEELFITNFNQETGEFQLAEKAIDLETGEYLTKVLYGYPGNVVIQAQTLSGFFTIKNNVISRWEAPVISFGTAEYNKNIHSITIVPEPIVGGEVEFGFKSKDKIQTYSVEGTNLMDFTAVDFTKFTFATSAFAKSFTKKIKAKNVNFLMFYFESTDNNDCAINQLSITYEIGKLNKGVK